MRHGVLDAVRRIDLRHVGRLQVVPAAALVFTVLARWTGMWGPTAAVLAVAAAAGIVASMSGRIAVWQALAVAPLSFILMAGLLTPRFADQAWVVAPACWSAVAGLLVAARWWSRAAAMAVGTAIGLLVSLVFPEGAFLWMVWLCPTLTVVLVELARATVSRFGVREVDAVPA